MQRLAMLALAGFVALGSLSAAAQSTLRIRATVSALSGNLLSVKSREGKDLQLNLAEDATVSAAKAVKLADIKPGDFIGPASRIGPDGKLTAISLQVFPESLKGVVPELHTPWDLEPGSMMTNGIVTAVVQETNGRELNVTVKGSPRTIRVPEGTPIYTTVPGDRGLLVPGAYIFAMARVGGDGKLTVQRITVSKDGVRPGV